jgi:uncharacterized protein (TIGR02147 family)
MQLRRDVFEFDDYKSYLKHLEEAGGRGYRAQLARAANCQIAYISQVLNGEAHLSLEQAAAINPFLSHNKRQSRHFLLLVQFNRAGTQELKNQFSDLLKESAENNGRFHDNINSGHIVGGDIQAAYYSDWTVVATHIALMVPHLRESKKIAAYLGLNEESVSRALEILVGAELACKEGDEYRPLMKQIHLSKESAYNARHHLQWRLKRIDRLERSRPSDLTYTSVASLSEKDFSNLKARFIEMVKSYNETVQASPEERVYCLTLDFFEVGGD